MKICVVQMQSFKGDIEQNIAKHLQFINTAVSHHADLIIFPELSITNYEPSLAQDLATTSEDGRFDTFQTISDEQNITIGIGVPLKTDAGLTISMILFRTNQARLTYAKKYIHADEKPFFISGTNFPTFQLQGTNIAPAICYEISIKKHAEAANQHGATIYVASVAKTAQGVTQAHKRLAQIAKQQGIPVLMSNNVGPADNFVGAGKTAVWDKYGNLRAQLDDISEGLIIFDTSNDETTVIQQESVAIKKMVEHSYDTAVETQKENETKIPYLWLLAQKMT